MKRRLLQGMAGTLLAMLGGVTVWTALLYADHGSLRLGWGTVRAGQQFLDDAPGILHEISWHFGNSLRTWGRTYGIQLGRHYISLQLTYVNTHVSRADARKDE